jgi:ferrochelatase
MIYADRHELESCFPHEELFDGALLVTISCWRFGKAVDVLPFLENVLRGKNIPRGGVPKWRALLPARRCSPINEQTKELIAALEQEFRDHGVAAGFGKPHGTVAGGPLKRMQADGIRHAAALVTRVWSYSGCEPVY